MPPGTAPRRILPGVWQTRTGRRLTPAGNAYWENQLKLGAVTADGHYNRQRGAQIRQLRSPNPTARTTAGRKLGAYAKGQQAALQSQADMGFSLTPVGAPIISAIDAVHAVKHHDALGAGVAGLGLIPLFGAARRAALAEKLARGAHKADVVAGPEQQVAQAFQAAKRVPAQEKKLRSAELGRRAAQMDPAFVEAGGGRAGHYAAKGQLKGPLPSVPFHKLRGITDDTLEQIINHVHEHPNLMPLEKDNLESSIINAAAGKRPTPYEIGLAERVFGKEKARLFARPSWWRHQLGRWLLDAANIPRTLMSSGDLSLNLRQTLLAFMTHPPSVLKTLGPQVKSAFSEKYYRAEMLKLASDPHVLEAKHAGAHFSDLGDPWTREEYFSSSLAEKATGGKYGPVRASSRAFTLGSNMVRRNFYKYLVESQRARGRPVTEQLRQHAALFADIATGQGRLGKLAPASPILNIVFFAPKLSASRIEGVLLPLMPGLHPAIRLRAARGMATFLVTGLGIMEAARLAGAEVGGDPTSADFGKIKIGNTRYDVWGGHQQYARLAWQMSTGKVTSTTTGKSIALKGGFGGLSQWSIGGRFLRSKESPLFSFVHDLASHETFLGQPFNLKTAVTNRVQPLLFQDAHAVQRDTGSLAKAAAAYGIGAFGVGVQDYKAKGSGKSKGHDPFARFNSQTQTIPSNQSDPFSRFKKR